jgi:hypothetical protein
MDDQRFDELSRKLATSVSRRQAVRIFGATAAGGLAALFGARGAGANHGAQCRHIGDNCRSNAECCERLCVDFHCACPGGTVVCPETNECVPACQFGKIFNPTTCQCECPPGQSECGEICCPDTAQCCNAQGFGFCCGPDDTCCDAFFQCCPPGLQCDPMFGCIAPQCQTPGFPCFNDQQCGQNCNCLGAVPPFLPGVCQ